MLGGQAGVRDHVRIGDGARVAAMSGVSKDVASRQAVRGIPAVDNRDFLRQQAALRKLSQLVTEVKALRTRVERIDTDVGEDSAS